MMPQTSTRDKQLFKDGVERQAKVESEANTSKKQYTCEHGMQINQTKSSTGLLRGSTEQEEVRCPRPW
jgi:hypothetical protein